MPTELNFDASAGQILTYQTPDDNRIAFSQTIRTIIDFTTIANRTQLFRAVMDADTGDIKNEYDVEYAMLKTFIEILKTTCKYLIVGYMSNGYANIEMKEIVKGEIINSFTYRYKVKI